MFMLNQFEIVHWYCFLKRLTYNVKSAQNVVQTSAYLTKKLLLKPQTFLMFENYFNKYDRRFVEEFDSWRKGPARKLELKPQEANEMFNELAKPFNAKNDKDFVDYNYLVDDILQISPPYQQGMVYKPTTSEVHTAAQDPKGLTAEPIPSVASVRPNKQNQAILEAMTGMGVSDDPMLQMPQLNPTLSFSELP